MGLEVCGPAVCGPAVCGPAVCGREFCGPEMDGFEMPGHEMNGPEMDAAALGALIRDVPDWPVPGVVFKDLTPLLADATALRSVVAGMTDAAGAVGRIDRVAGIEARGFLLGTPVAYRLGVGFVPLRKPGKLPRATLSRGYALEYGTAELHVHSDAFAPGERVLVVDDVLATGGTAAAAVELVRLAGAEPVALSVLLELTALGGRALLPDALPVHALLSS